jgi:chromosome segregation ATPase
MGAFGSLPAQCSELGLAFVSWMQKHEEEEKALLQRQVDLLESKKKALRQQRNAAHEELERLGEQVAKLEARCQEAEARNALLTLDRADARRK